MTTIWSCGGGVQSTAIAALICSGRLPRPDHAVIVDTTRERSTTWAYLYQVTAPELAAVGVEIVRVSAADFADTCIFEHGRLLLPAFVATGGRGGKLVNQCSSRWKRRVLQRWARSQGIREAEVWIGISTDELRRVRLSREWWWRNAYPLIDLGLSRSDCLAIVDRAGWPPPPKSSCWMCPHMRDAEWAALKSDWPTEFFKAVEIEEEMRVKIPRAYLTRHLVPLAEVEFGHETAQAELPWVGGCDSGYCWS